jgi:HEAT repeat protein
MDTKALDALLPELSADNLDARKAAREKFEDLCTNAARPGAEEDRAAASKAVVGLLGKDIPAATRVWLLRELWLIGGAECVPALAGLLGHADEETRDAARRALQKNPSPEAAAALVTALDGAQAPAVRAALLNALGGRGETAAVPAIAKRLADAAPEVALAAADALGRIGGPEADKALAAAGEKAGLDLRRAAAEARLRCAQRFLVEGKPDAAEAVYKDLAAKEPPGPARLAARHGLEAAALTRQSGKPEFPAAAAQRDG